MAKNTVVQEIQIKGFGIDFWAKIFDSGDVYKFGGVKRNTAGLYIARQFF